MAAAENCIDECRVCVVWFRYVREQREELRMQTEKTQELLEQIHQVCAQLGTVVGGGCSDMFVVGR
eukprot:52121-Rhodomonas_salina.5